jgi:hypothetical protein
LDGNFMRIAGETIGFRGITVLAAAGVVGIALGMHGWSVRHNGPPSSLAGPVVSPSATANPSPASSARPTSAPTQGPVASGPAPTSAASPSPSAGPELSAQSYARYAFQVWPGPVSQAARAAATGLVISVHQHGSGIMVAAGVAGQSKPVARFYPKGAKVYVIEAALGDDSGNTDFNLGDDGLVVTDSQGRIVQ